MQDTDIEVIDVSDNPAALDPMTKAEIDIAIATAKRYPRRLDRFVDNVLSMATVDQETAEGCFYSLRRSGKVIMGPSIRLAEIAVSAWGNIRAGARILGETEDGKFVRAMGVCHDLERNVFISMESQRRITNKAGRKFNDDMIGVTANAAAGIGFRNAVFKVIPRAMIKGSYDRCVEVATGGAKTLGQRRVEVFERLQRLNPMITTEKILASIEKPSIEEVTLQDVAHLIGLGTAIKDGAQSIDDAFPEPQGLKEEDILQPPAEKKKAQKEAAKLSDSKVKSLRRQAKESAGMDAAALDSWCAFNWENVNKLEDVLASHEVAVLDEIRRVAKAKK